MKYRFKTADGTPIDENVEATWERIAHALSAPDTAGPNRNAGKAVRRDFYEALEDFKYLPAGRIIAGAGTERTVTLFNCFVMGTIPDSMSGIFEMLKEAALTMQQGGGIGYDFSTIRPKTSWVKGVDSDASGPLSFMDCWDAMCRTVMSAGNRRGAMMATMRCDHPDIMDFITAKKDPTKLRMFNLSVLVTDDFMEAVKSDSAWDLVHVEPYKSRGTDGPILDHKGSDTRGRDDLPRYIHETVRARDLWNAIMESTYAQAEPGVIFIDRINRTNNLNYVETIAATNPCGEQPLPPYGACLLGSINLARLIKGAFTPVAGIKEDELRKLVRTAVRMMDNVVDVSNFPLDAQRAEAKAKRRIGLGVTGLANALAMCGLTYGSDRAVARTGAWMRIIDEAAYAASVDLAREKGAFPLFDADKFLAPGTHASELPMNLQEDIREFGIRNALLTSIAPTGTISLYAGNVSSGIEPVFAHGYTRKVLQKDGSKTEERVEDYAVAEYREKWENGDFNGGMPPVPAFDPDKHLPDYFVTAQTLSPMDHVRMQAVAQRHVDSSISKTINCPEDISFEDFKEVYMAAWDSGCKGCTTYRPNDITGSVLSVDEKPKTVEVEAEDEEYPTTKQAIGIAAGADKTYEQVLADFPQPEWHVNNGIGSIPEALPARPDELLGATYKIKVGDQKAVYLTINDVVESDGTVRPFEIFLRSSDPTHDEWMVAVAQLASAVMRRPHDASFIGPRLMRIASANSGGFQKGEGYQPSLVAAIGRQIKAHTERCSAKTPNMKWALELPELDVDSERYTRAKAFMDNMERNSSTLYDCPPDADHGPSKLSHPLHTACAACGSFNIKHESGCSSCADCGNSSCG